MTDIPKTLLRLKPLCLLSALLMLSFSQLATASDKVWVKIHHASDTPTLQALEGAESLRDYGRFQWGRLDRQQVEALEARGLNLAVEPNPFRVRLGGETFDPAERASKLPLPQAGSQPQFHLVQFDGPIRSRWLGDLRATGVEVAQPVHPFGYYVWGTAAQLDAARGLDRVRAAVPLQSEWKVQPHLRDLDSSLQPTMALASAHVDEARLRDELESFGIVHSVTPLNRHFRVVHLEIAGNDYLPVAELASIYTVQHVSQDAGPRGEMSNQSIVGGIDGDTIQTGYDGWLSDTGYTGQGVTVGIVDGGTQESHPDLTDNMVPCTGTEGSCTGASSSHGTHVAGAVGGTANSGVTDSNGFLRGQGVAPGASLVNQQYNPFLGSGPGGMVPEGMLRIYKDSAESGALLTNNSWGPSGTPQGYDIPTMEIDFISRDALPDEPGHQPVLAVWSIMNGNGDSSGDCAPSSLGAPDEAKNLFGVGSTGLQTGSGAQESIDDVFSVSSNSGHGPACDGRRVPDIVAPGCNTDSTDSGSSHSLKCGTSMASPVVSGAIALWAERYVEQTGVDPSPALMKAVFIAVAEDLVGGTNADGDTLDHRPDRFQGYGRLDLDAVMNPAGGEVYLNDQEEVFTETGQDWSLAFTAADPSEPIRVVLTWTDAPGHGQGGDTPAWVNDLDLQVDGLDGNTYLGNVIGGDGWSDTGGSADGMNNTEAVWLRPDQHQGGIDLSVIASEIAGDALNPHDPGDPSQDFALACYNCIIGDPTYSISVTPDSLGACIPETGSDDFDLDVELGQIGQYTGTVALSASGQPGGVTSSFDPASVDVPGSSLWTLSVSDAAAAGSYTLEVAGDDGTDQNVDELDLVLDTFLDQAPALVGPADGAADLTLTPTFEWDAITDIGEYRIQVATDSGFSNIVVDENVTQTSFTPASELATGTEYFWRVQGVNLCDGGDWSATRSFTTRLEPEAVFSNSEFDFDINSGTSDDATLEITNAGTGNLTFEIVSDDPNATRGGRDQHDPARDEVLDLPDFNLPGESTFDATAEAGIDTIGQVVGFTFEGTVSGISGEGTWASDMGMTITSPDGTSYDVGGYQTGYPDWDFQGSGSDDDGTYSSTHIGDGIFGAEGVTDEGTWQFGFEHFYQDTMDWSNVTVTLHKEAPPFCEDQTTTVDWLDFTPASGSIPEGDSEPVTVTVDATGLDAGEYTGYLCIDTNDPDNERVAIAVNLTVTIGIFRDSFEQ